jgi:transcriptional regulator with GAF, ATPase, and Fis domain
MGSEVGGGDTELRPRAESEALAACGYELFVSEGPNAGMRVAIDPAAPSRVLVGQSTVCAFRLDDGAVSRRHLALEVTERGLRMTDLDSTNGTFVNGVRATEVYLVGSETLRLGGTTVQVEAIGQRSTHALSQATAFGSLVGASPAMRRLYPLCERIAASSVPVIIEGETGTGKEVLAEALHEASARANGPFVVFDCTAVPQELFESALFGHEKGAFTGAVSTRKGAFEQAHGGTLFIDEVGDLAAVLQPKLLRAIERSEVQRVGAERWTKVDVRIVAATRRDLDEEIAAGRFRDDLFFRLSVARVELPPLRRRTGDVAVLARHFWRSLGGRTQPFPDDFVARFARYAWPGNVRELRNAVARRVALGDLAHGMGSGADEEDAPAAAASSGDLITRVLEADLPLALARREVTEAFERLYVERVLARHGGNIRKAATASGIARRYFQLLRARQAK